MCSSYEYVLLPTYLTYVNIKGKKYACKFYKAEFNLVIYQKVNNNKTFSFKWMLVFILKWKISFFVQALGKNLDVRYFFSNYITAKFT